MTPHSSAARRLITGVVLDEAGGPVPDARVYLAEGPGSILDIAALTGEDGRFSFPAQEEGVYTVQCRAPDDRGAEASTRVGGGEPAYVELRLLSGHGRDG
ncbi:carboxypeptidase regulatory-like domain-containing protein [Streptomyces sp. ISL-96]|uniref:carboxypeptidase-like regulatory domain-containing protein n=1 Tax=Streptomyces sp. ISL-96 TaxID=2819191 RepID=UPI001BE5DE27|nr:carboxypeptidase-like regulatory domain-containing protein [Streptomyces sp. ISL-96]MBT2490684.1 carboxypeptidase regulatory-like domain-containing protein [Streptomyces sp. ISL-96]